jgi:hypothetical protein
MGFWDAGTHMSKREWRTACQRVQNRLEDLSKSQAAPGQKSKTKTQGKRAPAAPEAKAK